MYLFDGDNVWYGFNCDFGFIEVDCVENIWCVVEVVWLMFDVGFIMFVLFILLFCVECDMVCVLVGLDEFVEVFVDMLFVVVEECDLKGLYKKVWCGELKYFIGIDLLYELFV